MTVLGAAAGGAAGGRGRGERGHGDCPARRGQGMPLELHTLNPAP